MRDNRRGKRWLLALARRVAANLKEVRHGTCLRIRTPSRATWTDTDGWYAVIGDLGPRQPRLEVWLDRYSGYPDRKFWYGFYFYREKRLQEISAGVSRGLLPIRTITWRDVNRRERALTERLPRDQFNAPLLEKYGSEGAFFGVFDRTSHSIEADATLRATAVAFFNSVARTLPRAKPEDDTQEVYPQVENRMLVVSHLRRERSRLLATARKIQDKYRCQVCTFRFTDLYGTLGDVFAEAHHRVALSRLREGVTTSIEDLVTVCANCHRMLHRMSGGRDDVKTLRDIVRAHRKPHR
jgi:5-methylcytosine-specific restriction endonuclease McrA